MALQRATEADHLLRDERTDLLEPVDHPIADRVSAKQRQVQAMASRWYDLTTELP